MLVLARRGAVGVLILSALGCVGRNVGPDAGDVTSDRSVADVQFNDIATEDLDGSTDGSEGGALDARDAGAFDGASDTTSGDAADAADAADAPTSLDGTDTVDIVTPRDVATVPDVPSPTDVATMDAGPGNARCATATTVVHGTSLPSESLAGATDALTACLPAASGAVLYYLATVPAGHAITASVNPRSAPAPDFVLRLLPGCGAATCISSSNELGAGFPETLTWRNPDAAPRAVILAVGTATRATSLFRLDVAIRPASYAEVAIPRACDDLAGATIVAGVSSDDSTSSVAALPFAITFFGESATHWSVNSNGLMMLFNSAVGFTSSTRANVDIPDPTFPNRYVAPFWDDLALPGSGTNDARAMTFGTAPNRRFVVQWTNWALASDVSAHATFQVKLFESSHVVEFHYCQLMPGISATQVTGAGATVGLEDSTGVVGHRHSFNMPGSISAASALRFSPRP